MMTMISSRSIAFFFKLLDSFIFKVTIFSFAHLRNILSPITIFSHLHTTATRAATLYLMIIDTIPWSDITPAAPYDGSCE